MLGKERGHYCIIFFIGQSLFKNGDGPFIDSSNILNDVFRINSTSLPQMEEQSFLFMSLPFTKLCRLKEGPEHTYICKLLSCFYWIYKCQSKEPMVYVLSLEFDYTSS
jgi:hypothetical protein